MNDKVNYSKTGLIVRKRKIDSVIIFWVLTLRFVYIRSNAFNLKKIKTGSRKTINSAYRTLLASFK